MNPFSEKNLDSESASKKQIKNIITVDTNKVSTAIMLIGAFCASQIKLEEINQANAI